MGPSVRAIHHLADGEPERAAQGDVAGEQEDDEGHPRPSAATAACIGRAHDKGEVAWNRTDNGTAARQIAKLAK